MDTIQNPEYFKGRGAQVNTHNKFAAQRYVAEHIEGLDEEFLENSNTQLIEENPKKIISVNDSPDLRMGYSLNPYQGCEHGCIYCYARNAHEYWGYSAGLDFERKIIVKRNAAIVLERQFNARGYQPQPIMLSGNTDRSEEHTSELQSLMRISYAVFCLKKKTKTICNTTKDQHIRLIQLISDL